MKEYKEEPEVVVEKRALVGEGSIWDAKTQRLYWVDILSNHVYIYDPKTKENRTIDVCQFVGTIVLRASGGVMLALHNGFASLNLDTEKVTAFGDPERFIPANRFNDGKCDPAGRFWAGTMEFFGEKDKGALYCLDTDHSISKKVSPVSISNGIVWSLDHKTMYYIDTPVDNVRAWDYDIDTGDIKNERVVIENSGEGHFDGMTIDEEGMLWIAVFGGWGVKRYNPLTGELIANVPVPANSITSCAFGGENLDELYVTSATYKLEDKDLAEQPLAGSLLKYNLNVRGVPAYEYAG